MSKSLFLRVLITLFLTGVPVFAQSLYDVVASLSDRQRVVIQRSQVQAYQHNQFNDPDGAIPMDEPIDWHSVGTNPNQASVDELGMGDKIAVLNQAVQEFEKLKFNFLNCGNIEFSTGANIANLPSYGESDFDPLPRATHENYHALLLALAQRVSCLRTMSWVAGFNQFTQTRKSYVFEYLVPEGEDYVKEIFPENLPANFDWKPAPLGPDGFLETTTNDRVYTLSSIDAQVRATGGYGEETQEGILLRSATHEMVITYPESAQLITTAPGAQGTQIDGVVSILRRSKWHKLSLTGAHEHFATSHAGHVVVGSGNTQSIPLIAATPAPSFNGTWKTISEGEGYKSEAFITNGYEYLEANYLGEQDAHNAYENSWQVGSSYNAVFKPTFSRGIDAPEVRAKLESTAAVLAGTSADGKFLLNPRPGLLFGLELGAGLNGMGNGYISCGNPRGPRAGTHGLERFDSSYNLQFAGNSADYHIVYDNDRTTRTQTMPGIGWPRPLIFGSYYFDYWTLFDAWDSPRLKQIVGRELIADVTYNEKHYGGYTVNIYRRPTNSPALVPGQALPITGMIAIRTWTFTSDNGEVAHPNAIEHLKATGKHGEQFVIQAEHVLTDYEWDHWQIGWSSTWYGEPTREEQGIPYWRAFEGSWGWTLTALQQGVEGQPPTEKYRREIDMTTWMTDWMWPLADYSSKDYVDGQLVSTFTSMSTEPFSNRTPAEWEIVMDGKTISGTADLGDPFEPEPAFGYGKWPLSMTIDYGDIQPSAEYEWDSKGMLSSHIQGLWSLTGTTDGYLATYTNKFNEITTGTNWIEFLNAGNKVKTYSAPDGLTTDKANTKVAWSEIEYGTATNGLPGLPLKLSNIDGSATKWTWAPATDKSGTLTVESGYFTDALLTAGTRQTSSWNTRGHTKESETELIADGTVSISSFEVPAEQFTAWGAPKEWKNLYSETSTLINYNGGLSRPESVTSPLGLTTAYSNYDVLGRPGQIVSNGITATNTYTGLGLTTTYGGTGVMAGSQTSFTRNAIGTSTESSITWGGINQAQETERGETTTTITGSHDLLGSSEATVRNEDGSLSAADNATLAFGGIDGDALSIDNGLFVTKTAVAEVAGTFAETHTDAWGRIHKVVTPSKSSGSTETTFDYSLPSETLKRVVTTDSAGRKLITESDTEEMISRSGIDVNKNGSLGASDRYTESTTEVAAGKIVTILKVTEDSGMREVLRSEITPATGVTVTKINGNEETITTTPDYEEKTVTTESSKGWERTTEVNSLGLATSNSLAGTGIPSTSLSPVWRADGSLASVSLTIGGETHTASFNEDKTLASLTAPGRGNILGGHSISNGVESLTVNGKTIQRKLDGTEKSTSGGNVIAKSEVLSKSGSGYKKTVTPAVGAATETAYNAALATTGKTYADSTGETLTYIDELVSSITLARGGALNLDYSNDGAKDLTAATWPAVASGPFTIPGIGHGFEYNRSGQIKTYTDPSGTRSLAYQNGRLSSSLYTAGVLKGYQIIPGRDEFGRQTGVLLKRDGNTVHTTAKALNGASDQITNLASGNITATPQRNAAGNIVGYIWSDGTNSVSQIWTRGAGGRITEASSDVPNAPSFNYAPDENSFDAFGRRLKCETAGGTWEYTYGAGGQLSSAIHPTLGTFTYSFDGIGRRTDKGEANTTDILNRTTAWTHNQNKTLSIKADPDARVWFNGVEIENFNGTHNAAITPPGAEGGWVPWETLAVLEGAGEGAGDPAANPLADPDAKSEKRGAVWVPPAAETFTFDAAGNRQSSAQFDYGWDAKNQLARVRTKNHTTAAQAYDISNTYDSEGRRIKKHVIEYQNGAVVSEKIITFIWDGWDLLYERHQLPSGLTTLERKYLWGPDIADGAAGGAGGLLLIRETKGSVTTNIIPLYDGTGHVCALTDINKNLLATYQYGPFGEKISATGTHAQSNPWRYTTKYLDAETGLYYYGNRYLDPITGQFISRDPLGENESLNLYQNGHGDPINNIDRQGLESVPVYQSQISQAMARLGWAQHEHELKARAIDADFAKWLELFAAAEEAGQKHDGRLLAAVSNLHGSGHAWNDFSLENTRSLTMGRVDIATAGLQRIYKQTSFLEWAADMKPGHLNPADDPEYFDDNNPEFRKDEWVRRFIQFNPGGKIARESVNGNYGAASYEFGKEVAIWSTLGVAGEFVGTGRVVFSATRTGMGGFAAAGGGIDDLAVIALQPADDVVWRSSNALAAARGESVVPLERAFMVGSPKDLVTVVAHGNGNSLANMTYKEFATLLQAHGFKGVGVELVACKTGSGPFAQGLANTLRVPVIAAKGNVNVLGGFRGIPQVTSGGSLLPVGQGFSTFQPQSGLRALIWKLRYGR